MFLNSLLILIIILIESSFLSQNNNYKLIYIPQVNNGAKCVDGSAPTIYIKDTETSLDEKKILFYFTGGAFAQELSENKVYEKLKRRLKTRNGSNKFNKQRAHIEGIMSDDQEKNPYFYDYTVIFVNYCDGTAFTGHLDEPILYKGKKLWVRGQDNMLAILDYAKKYYKLQNADQVVVGGTSSGAVVVYNWIDYISNYVKKLNPKTQVVALADAGMFLNYKKFGTDFYEFLEKQKNLYIYTRDIDQEQPFQNKKCMERYQNEPWKCIMSQYLLEFIETPILVVNSSFDAWNINDILGITCVKKNHIHDYTGCSEEQIAYIDQFHNDFLEEIIKLKKKTKNAHFILLPCVNHDNLNKPVYYFAGPETVSPIITLAHLTGQFVEQERLEIDGLDLNHWYGSSNCELVRQQVWKDFDRMQFFREYQDGELDKIGL